MIGDWYDYCYIIMNIMTDFPGITGTVGGATMVTGTIFNIQKYSIHDGPGIRTTVFLKGCPLNCWWCHNPESQERQLQLVLWRDRCLGCGDCKRACPNNAVALQDGIPHIDKGRCLSCGVCAGACPTGAMEVVGKTVTTEYVIKEIEKDLIFYDQSGGGVTFSGGEPLMQPEFLEQLIRDCKSRDIHTAVDTSGYASWDVLSGMCGSIDLILYDIKHMDDQMHIKTTGVSNRVILDNLEKLSKVHNNIVIRVPLVPGINDDHENIVNMARFISSINVREVNILPYHNTGMDKYGRLGKEYRLPHTKEPAAQSLDSIKETLMSAGLYVKIGG